jgi:ankyrin repeat protein
MMLELTNRCRETAQPSSVDLVSRLSPFPNSLVSITNSVDKHRHAAVVSLLLDYHLEHGTGIEINAVTSHGWTPLHWASRNGHLNVVRVLLRRGADPMLKSKAGQAPEEWALLGGHQAVADLLRWFVAKSRKKIEAAG